MCALEGGTQREKVLTVPDDEINSVKTQTGKLFLMDQVEQVLRKQEECKVCSKHRTSEGLKKTTHTEQEIQSLF